MTTPVPVSEPPDLDARPPAFDATARVTELLLDAVLAQPLQALLEPALHGRLLHAALRGYFRRSPDGDGPPRQLPAAIDSFTRWLREQPNLRAVLPPEACTLLRNLARHPYVPERAVILGLLSRPPLRALVRELMVGMLLDYGRKLRSATTEPPPAGRESRGGLGALGRLAGEAVRKGGAAAMALAPGVATAVSDEFERQMLRRATEFADGAVDELLQKTAATLTDPQRGRDVIELKLSLLDHLLAMRGAELAAELQRLEPAGLYELVRAAGQAFCERETAEAELCSLVQWLCDRAPARTARALLEDAAVLPPVRAALVAYFAQAVRPLIESGALLAALSAHATSP